MFSYGDFLERCLRRRAQRDHLLAARPQRQGPRRARRRPRAPSTQEMAGLKAALAPTGRPIVNVDIVVNRGTSSTCRDARAVLRDGRAASSTCSRSSPSARLHRRARHPLLRPRRRCARTIQEALRVLEEARRPHLDEPLPAAAPGGLRAPHPGPVQAERRGARPEGGVRAPRSTRASGSTAASRRAASTATSQQLCDTLEGVIDTVEAKRFEVVRVDTEWEAKQPPVFGGDPASARRSKEEASRRATENGKRVLPLFEAKRVPVDPRGARRRIEATTLRVCAPDVAEAAALIARFPGSAGGARAGRLRGAREGALEGAWRGRELVRVGATDARRRPRRSWLSSGHSRSPSTSPSATARGFFHSPRSPARIALRQPNYERLTEAVGQRRRPAGLLRALHAPVPVEQRARVHPRAPAARSARPCSTRR